MQLEGRRKSSNVEDRRRGGGAAAAGGIGLGGIIIAGLIWLLTGQDPSAVLQTIDPGTITTTQNTEVASAEDQELFDFASIILAGTEDVWTQIFQKNGLTYVPPKLVIFDGSVQSACGGATAESKPEAEADAKTEAEADAKPEAEADAQTETETEDINQKIEIKLKEKINHLLVLQLFMEIILIHLYKKVELVN